MKTLVLVLAVAMSTTACGTFFEKVKPVEVVSKPVERMPLNIETPALEGLPVPEFIIVTPENQEQVWQTMAEKGENPVLFGVTDIGYKDLATLMSQVRAHIWLQKEVLDKYKNYYEPPKANK